MLRGLAWVLLGACAREGRDDTGVAAVPAWLDLGPAAACPAPLDRPAWTDVARDWGLGGIEDPDAEHSSSAGASLADLDGDGDTDVALAYAGTPATIFLRDGDAFVRGPALDNAGASPRAVGLLDPDGDGDWDLFVASQDSRRALFRNDGDLVFTDVTSAWLPLPSNPSFNLLAEADWDLDGDLDAYAPATKTDSTDRPDLLLRNDGTGVLAPVPEGVLPATDGSATLQAFWFDADGDGRPEANAANDFGWTMGGNAQFRNAGDHFVDVSETCQCTPETGSMSGDVGDVDGDGDADFYLANADGSNLFVNDGAGTFVDYGAALGANERDNTGGATMVWSALFLDYDNDADLDLYTAHGDFYSALEPFEPTESDDALLEQQADGTFLNVAPALGLASPDSERSVLAEDFNGDGVLDILTTVITDWPHLYLSDGCTAPGWIEVEVEGPGMNPHGTGAEVAVTAGGRRQVAWLWPQSGLNATRAPRVHFGLGDAQTVDRIEVTLPTGERYVSDSPFAARRRVGIRAR